MVKPLDQTWMATPKGVQDQCGALVFHAPALTEEAGPTVRLAAKAPEMARMLLVLAGGTQDPYCNGCGHLGRNLAHKDDCDLWRVLVEAGVVPGASILQLVK
jgi:hypothetical protein